MDLHVHKNIKSEPPENSVIQRNVKFGGMKEMQLPWQEM